MKFRIRSFQIASGVERVLSVDLTLIHPHYPHTDSEKEELKKFLDSLYARDVELIPYVEKENCDGKRNKKKGN